MRGKVTRSLGPIVAAVAGIALLVAGIVSVTGDDNVGVSDALRSSGVFDRTAMETPAEIPPPSNTIANRTANHDPTPTSTPAAKPATTTTTTAADPVWETWQVALFTSFEDDVAWDYGVATITTRDFQRGGYTVSLAADSGPVFVPTWQDGYQPEADFRLAVDIADSSGSAACGLVVGSKGLPAMFFVTDSSDGDFFVRIFTTSDTSETLADGVRPIAIHAPGDNHLALLKEGDTITVFSNGTPLATFEQPAFEITTLGLATFAPADNEIAVCEFDNFEIRWP